MARWNCENLRAPGVLVARCGFNLMIVTSSSDAVSRVRDESRYIVVFWHDNLTDDGFKAAVHVAVTANSYSPHSRFASRCGIDTGGSIRSHAPHRARPFARGHNAPVSHIRKQQTNAVINRGVEFCSDPRRVDVVVSYFVVTERTDRKNS